MTNSYVDHVISANPAEELSLFGEIVIFTIIPLAAALLNMMKKINVLL